MPDNEDKSEEKPKPDHMRLTRAEIREALTCPICKKPGAMLDDVCGFCGSHQGEDGSWIVPTPMDQQRAPKSNKVPWYEEEL